MNLTSFYLLIDFVISNIMQFFAVSDSVVIVDDPRFTFFNFFVSVIFVGLLIKTITWLRGATASGGRSRFRLLEGKPAEKPQMQISGTMKNYHDDTMSYDMWKYGKE